MWYNQRSETGKGMKQGKWARLYRPELSVEPGALNGSATKPRVHFQFTKHVEPKPVWHIVEKTVLKADTNGEAIPVAD